MQIQEKVGLVTGAASGIGRATALELINQGVKGLALVDISRASPYTPSTLAFYEHTALPQVRSLQERLEGAGNALHTFEKTYMEYKEQLIVLREAIETAITRIKCYTTRREHRRQQKGKQTLLQTLKSM